MLTSVLRKVNTGDINVVLSSACITLISFTEYEQPVPKELSAEISADFEDEVRN